MEREDLLQRFEVWCWIAWMSAFIQSWKSEDASADMLVYFNTLRKCTRDMSLSQCAFLVVP